MIKKILVSQPKPASEKSPYFDIQAQYGVECVFRPFFKVEGLSSKEFRQQKINLLDYTAVVFTSRHAVDNYFKLAPHTTSIYTDHLILVYDKRIADRCFRINEIPDCQQKTGLQHEEELVSYFRTGLRHLCCTDAWSTEEGFCLAYNKMLRFRECYTSQEKTDQQQ
jgi:hypothetical protein